MYKVLNKKAMLLVLFCALVSSQGVEAGVIATIKRWFRSDVNTLKHYEQKALTHGQLSAASEARRQKALTSVAEKNRREQDMNGRDKYSLTMHGLSLAHSLTTHANNTPEAKALQAAAAKEAAEKSAKARRTELETHKMALLEQQNAIKAKIPETTQKIGSLRSGLAGNNYAASRRAIAKEDLAFALKAHAAHHNDLGRVTTQLADAHKELGDHDAAHQSYLTAGQHHLEAKKSAAESHGYYATPEARQHHTDGEQLYQENQMKAKSVAQSPE